LWLLHDHSGLFTNADIDTDADADASSLGDGGDETSNASNADVNLWWAM
jgi:hypothetical protein